MLTRIHLAPAALLYVAVILFERHRWVRTGTAVVALGACAGVVALALWG